MYKKMYGEVISTAATRAVCEKAAGHGELLIDASNRHTSYAVKQVSRATSAEWKTDSLSTRGKPKISRTERRWTLNKPSNVDYEMWISEAVLRAEKEQRHETASVLIDWRARTAARKLLQFSKPPGHLKKKNGWLKTTWPLKNIYIYLRPKKRLHYFHP